MEAVVLVPRRAGEPVRDAVWLWVEKWWREHVRLPIFEGHHEGGPFNRAAALNAAAGAAGEWEVAFLIDADVILDPANVRAALAAASGTGGPVLAYRERIHLNAKGSRRIMDGYKGDWRPFTRTQLFDSCSSALAVTRDLWDAVGGFDETFSGWGWEDVAFRIATETLSGTELVKLQGTLWHLWHPKSPENDNQRATFIANRARGDRYKAARWNPEAVRALIEEASDPQEVHQDGPGHDDPGGRGLVAAVPDAPP